MSLIKGTGGRQGPICTVTEVACQQKMVLWPILRTWVSTLLYPRDGSSCTRAMVQEAVDMVTSQV